MTPKINEVISIAGIRPVFYCVIIPTTMGCDPNSQELVFSRDALAAIDRDAVKQFGIPSMLLMENAARGTVDVLLDRMQTRPGGDVAIICGSGNNGGDGYAVARHLANVGCHVRVLCLGDPKMSDARSNASIAAKMGIPITKWTNKACFQTALLIDAIFGTGLDRDVGGIYAEAINGMNSHSATRVALDIPSGLDCDTGVPQGCSVRADLTVSFVGRKLGFMSKSSARYTGQVAVVGIGCPQTLLHKYGTPPT